MTNSEMKIEIRPIPNRGGIKSFSENLEYFSQSHVISPFVNPRTLRYETGLDEKDIAYLEKQGCPYELQNNYVKGQAHPFWESSMVKVELKNTPIFLFPKDNIIDFIKWKFLTVNNYIYRSEQELKTGSKPQATHFIYNESEEMAIKATKLEQRNSLIKEVSKLSLTRKRDLILIIENEITENKKEDYLTIKFEDIINDSTKAAKLLELLTENPESISLISDIKSAIHKNVLQKTKQGIFYFETNLGFQEDDVKAFLEDPENQEILLNIKSKIN